MNNKNVYWSLLKIKYNIICITYRLFLGLTRGTVEPDTENIAFYMDIDKETDKIYIGSKVNGVNTSAGDVSESFSEVDVGRYFWIIPNNYYVFK